MRKQTLEMPLHWGKAPRWLFEKMVRLSREIARVISYEYGTGELLNRLSDPVWFQSFGCVLGFDWHSSGVTTTACGALKEALKDGFAEELGLYVCGGKGKTSRKTPEEIRLICEKTGSDADKYIYLSKIIAKIDSACVQDGYQLYHHNFIFNKNGAWCVVQQGMNETNHYARRYHWLGEATTDLLNEPHTGICSQKKENIVLDLTSKESEKNRSQSCSLANESPEKVIKEITRITKLEKLPERHEVLIKDINPDKVSKILLKTYEKRPENFEKLLSLEGVGAKTIRALALVSDLIYGFSPSYNDPARYSFAHGGKDGTPFPVDRKMYENTIIFLKNVLDKAKLGDKDKISAFSRLSKI